MRVVVTQLCQALCDAVDSSHQAPLSMRFFRQEHWGELPFPTLRELPHPGIEPGSPALQADSLLSEPPRNPHLTTYPPRDYIPLQTEENNYLLVSLICFSQTVDNNIIMSGKAKNKFNNNNNEKKKKSWSLNDLIMFNFPTKSRKPTSIWSVP